MRLGLAGDTMLGRQVADVLAEGPPNSLFSAEVVDIARQADLLLLNLECCISERGSRWPDPDKPFFFRALPAAIEVLSLLEVDCVTLANNHALDYGPEALADTLELVGSVGIAAAGAGRDVEEARAPISLEHDGFRLRVVGFTDHPRDFAAGPDRPGVAYVDLHHGLPDWLAAAVGDPDADAVLVTPHWGPNMTDQPVARVRSAARLLLGAGATLIAGHSAHVFQGVAGPVLYDLGDFIDDYAVDPRLRNDLGLFFFLEVERRRPVRLEAVPLRLDYCRTDLARGEDFAWISRRFRRACAEFGTEVTEQDGRLVADLTAHHPIPVSS